MPATAIKVEGLGKLYTINELRHRRSLSERVANMMAAPFRRFYQSDDDYDLPNEIWALRDVSFELEEGRILGVIGRNGSGKSTLLRVLGRISLPTEGRAWLRGRVGVLLEIGTGFHPELSGRENIYLSGTMIGMTHSEIQRREEQIIDFAEVENFVDTPVKHYSTGMFTRLAFAVAAHLDAEIMLVDEVLAVGDGAFQEKCKQKIRETALSGKTVLFTSHDMGAINSLCHSCILLDGGRMAHYGDIRAGIRKYFKLSGLPESLMAELDSKGAAAERASAAGGGTA